MLDKKKRSVNSFSQEFLDERSENMAVSELRNAKGQVVGRIEGDNLGNQRLKNRNGGLIARFDGKATYYPNGTKVGDGNLLSTLIPTLMN